MNEQVWQAWQWKTEQRGKRRGQDEKWREQKRTQRTEEACVDHGAHMIWEGCCLCCALSLCREQEQELCVMMVLMRMMRIMWRWWRVCDQRRLTCEKKRKKKSWKRQRKKRALMRKKKRRRMKT